ncbi:MAG: MBL fold metallo-hydrolase [Rubricoccaceae bacterium]
MRYLSLGDTEDIAASCHHLEIAGTGLVLDAGMDPDAEGFDALPPFELLRGLPVDHVVVTHAHHDHLGALPVLLREVPHARIHMTPATMRLADVLLPASARLQKRRLREGAPGAAQVFDTETAEALTYLYEAHPLDTDFDLSGARATAPLTARFYHAGHVLGAAGLYLEAEEDGRRRRVFYTSDTSLRPQSILPGAHLPHGPLDLLLLEATLGADPEAERTTRKEQEKQFGEALAATIARGGRALVPVFALGRAQDVLAMIDRFKRRGVLPAETPVYTAGSMRAVAEIYDATRHSTPRLDPDFEVYAVEQQRLPRTSKRLSEALAAPGIFVVSSGMLFQNTPSHALAQHVIEDETNAVFFVGFNKEGSPGDELVRAAEAGPGATITLDELRGPQPVRATVRRFRFTGHAHRQDLIDVVAQTEPATVVLVHGETAAKEWMREALADAYPDLRVIIPEQGAPVEL